MGISRRIKSAIRYGLLALSTLLLITLLLTGLVYYIAVSDQEQVPVLVEDFSREELGVEATFEHYRFQYFKHFPFLSLSLRNVIVQTPDTTVQQQELLRIKEIDVVFRPWKLLQKKYELRSISLDTARLMLYRDAEGQFNAAALQFDSTRMQRDSNQMLDGLFKIKAFKVNGLYVDYLDSLQRKHHRLEVKSSTLNLHTSDTARHVSIRGSWQFHQLVFRMKNGPFFKQQGADVDLQLAFLRSAPKVRLEPSTLQLDKDTLQLSGYFESEGPGFLRLDIKADDLLLADAKPLLANNLQEALKPYRIDQPLQVKLKIEGATHPGKRQPLSLDISGEHLTLATKRLRFSTPKLQAHYRNDCDSTGIPSPYKDCLRLTLDQAMLFDTIPLYELEYFDFNLRHPEATFSGRTRVALTKLNGYIPQQDWQVSGGWLDMKFQFAGQPNDLIDPAISTLRPSFSAEGQISEAGGQHTPSATRFKNSSLNFTLDRDKLYVHHAKVTANEQALSVRGAVYGLPALLFQKPTTLSAELDITAGAIQLDRLIDSSPETGKRSMELPPYRLALNFSADRLAYRKLRLDQARFRVQLNSPCLRGDTCIRIESIQGLAYQQLPIRGRAALTSWPNPDLDLKLQLDAPLTDAQRLLPEGQVRLQRGQLSLDLRYQGQLRDYADISEAALRAKLYGRVNLHNASADYLPKGYRFREVNTSLHFDEKQLYIDTLSGQLNGNAASAYGEIQGLIPFIFGETNTVLQARLRLDGKKIDLNNFSNKPLPDAAGPVPSGRKAAVSFNQLLARLKGKLNVRTDTLIYRSMQLSEVAFQSTIGPDCGDEHSCIIVDSLSAQLFGSTPICAKGQVTQLQDPFLSAEVEVDMPVQELNRMFAPGQFRFGNGYIQLGFSYEGQPHKHFDVEGALLKAKIEGKGQLLNTAFSFRPRGYDFKQVQAAFSFDGEDLKFDTLDVLLNGNRLRGSGAIRDFLPFIFLPKQKLDASLRVNTKRFDLNRFKAPEKFQTDSTETAERPTIITRLVNAGLKNIKTDFDIQMDTVVYRNFKSYQVEGAVQLGEGSLAFKRTRMQLADGQFELSGVVEGLRENQPELNLAAQVRGTDIRKFFQAFDDFGQQTLTAQNLKGTLSGNLNFQGRANANYELAPQSMHGRFELLVEDGSLINLPALDSIRNILFRNRDLSHIEFATLENTFYLDGRDLHIGHFHVPSSVLTFSVNGLYSLADAERTNLLFEIPFANLFRRDLSRTALENIEAGAESGPNILIRAKSGEEGLRFKWVLSRKE